MTDHAENAEQEAELGSPVAREFLENLQESIYSTGLMGRPIVADLTDEQRAELEEDGYQRSYEILRRQEVASKGELSPEREKELKENARTTAHEFIWGSTPTRFEEPATYGIVKDLAESVENSMKDILGVMPIRPRPAIGTLPTGQVNAMAIRVPNTDEHVIVFESQIFNFCLLFSKAVTLALPFKGNEDGFIKMSTDMDDVRQRIEAEKEITQRFFEVVAAYVIEGTPGDAPPYLPPEPWGTVAGAFRDAMEFFIMGHEYSHILLQHTAQGEKTAALLGGDQAEVLAWSHQQEIDADGLGVFLLMGSADVKLDPAMSFVGVSLFFGALAIVERAVTLLHFGEERQLSSRTHPAHTERLRSARDAALACPFVPEKDHVGVVQLAEVIDTITETLWERSRPVLVNLRDRGFRPHRIWTGAA
jgi:hypothetical protein